MSTPSSIKESNDDSRSNAEPGTSRKELLKRIAELEEKNKELEQKVSAKESLPFPTVTSADVYDNLKRLQDNFMERFGRSFNELRTGFDLQPFLEAAARSRGLAADRAIALAPPKKRQLSACVITFALLPMSMLISTTTVFLALYLRSPILIAICVIYGAYIYMDQSSCDRGGKAWTWLKRHGFWKSLRFVKWKSINTYDM